MHTECSVAESGMRRKYVLYEQWLFTKYCIPQVFSNVCHVSIYASFVAVIIMTHLHACLSHADHHPIICLILDLWGGNMVELATWYTAPWYTWQERLLVDNVEHLVVCYTVNLFTSNITLPLIPQALECSHSSKLVMIYQRFRSDYFTMYWDCLTSFPVAQLRGMCFDSSVWGHGVAMDVDGGVDMFLGTLYSQRHVSISSTLPLCHFYHLHLI